MPENLAVSHEQVVPKLQLQIAELSLQLAMYQAMVDQLRTPPSAPAAEKPTVE